ncbi:protein FRIGIDA-ESSENTIAL 1 [Abrus precatorius]|uniref:Protein FRIGIDA-ESSENTIAL 1 n=1 Tax=Abrus precatorius TaxID=3816 RepID=A0A8B8MBY4_ABRPR|nr:protein FRIGIDA-ESSENTIAL 1 [Abrus precatorius]
MEFEGQEKNLGPVSFVANCPEVMPPSNMHYIEGNDVMLKGSVPSCETPTLEKDEYYQKYEISSHPKSRENLTSVEEGKSQGLDVDIENAGSLLQRKTIGQYGEPSCNSKANLSGDNDSDSIATKTSNDTGKDMVIDCVPRDCLVEDVDSGRSSKNKTMQSEMELRDDVKQMTSRRTRSLSPSAKTKDGNKRAKIICDFFAKGWCIRGSSCSFLHIEDTVNNSDQEAEEDLVTTHQKRELKVEEGVRENVERSRMNEQEASPSCYPSQEKQNFLLRDNLFPENRFAFSASNNYFSPNLSSNPAHADGMNTIGNQHMYKGYTSSILSHSSNSSLVTQFPAISMPLSHRISAQSGCSLPFSSSFTLDSQKLLNKDKEYLTTKSTFSGSGREDLSLVSSSRVAPYSSGYKSKICSYDWDPSVPFRPSFFITSMNVSTPGDLYDPLRDSIEIPNIGDGSLKASLLVHGSTVQASSQVQTCGDSAVVGKHMSDLNDDKSSVSSHNRFCENGPNKNCVPHENDCHVPETEITSGSYLNYHPNGKMSMGQHTFDVEDSTKKDIETTERDARHHGEGSGHKKKRVDRDKKNHEMDVDFQMDDSMQKESKALRNFRATLVDLVKELLKPAWHEGRLSKDAHIMIVKKSVDKVVSTLEPHQIPTSIDTAKQYVSSCRVKITKLVNGYVNKYCKS